MLQSLQTLQLFIDLLHIGNFRTVSSLWRNIFWRISEKSFLPFLEPQKARIFNVFGAFRRYRAFRGYNYLSICSILGILEQSRHCGETFFGRISEKSFLPFLEPKKARIFYVFGAFRRYRAFSRYNYLLICSISGILEQSRNCGETFFFRIPKRAQKACFGGIFGAFTIGQDLPIL